MRCLILGVTGQDGSYLAEHLVADGHEVFGLGRRVVKTPLPGVRYLLGDLLDPPSLRTALRVARPDEVYNLAAVTAPGAGWGAARPSLLVEVTGLGVINLLEAVAAEQPAACLVHASSSAVYDLARYGLYGAAKQLAHTAVAGFRSQLHASNAVFYSHTSPRQDSRFLARYVTTAIAHGERLRLTDISARRDWGYAPDYIRALPIIARQAIAADWVVRTGEDHSVEEMIDIALAEVGRDWRNIDTSPGQRVPAEILADLPTPPGWKPETSFAGMVTLMVRAALTDR